MIDRDAIYRDIETLSPESMDELGEFIAYLHYKEGRRGSPWLKDLYDAFAPVREAVAESGMSEEAVDQTIDEAIEAVRRERRG